MKIYVAGPMRGIKDFNFPAFDQAAYLLRARGHDVLNPADKDRQDHGSDVNRSETGDLADIEHTGFNLRETLAWDLNWIAANADAIAVLPGWENSKGATAEVALALALGLLVAPVESFGDAAWHDDEVVAGTQYLLAGQVTEIPDKHQPDSPPTTEVRTISATGGEKGVKLARYDLIPADPLWQLAELYGVGASKYQDRNWERGYEWSKSYAALQRHLALWWAGQDNDTEMSELAGKDISHLAAVAWHAFALLQFETFLQYRDFDDRPKPGFRQALKDTA